MPVHSSGGNCNIPFIDIAIGCFVIAFILVVLLFGLSRMTYIEEGYGQNKHLERYKFSLAFYITPLAALFIPIANVCVALGELIYFLDEGIGKYREYQIGKKDILNKKI